MGGDSSVGIATRYGLDSPGIESWWRARFSAPVQTGPGTHPASCTMSGGPFQGLMRPRRGVGHPLPSSAEIKERVDYTCPLPPFWAFVACSRGNFTFCFYVNLIVFKLAFRHGCT